VKRLLLFGGAAVAALLGGLFLRAAGPQLAPQRALPAAAPTPLSAAPPSPPVPAAPARDIFRYTDQAPLRRPEAPIVTVKPPTTQAPPPLEPPAPEPVRLVGLVQRGGAWRAALSINDDVVVLGVGEASGGYQLVAIDAAEGVTVRDPQGQQRRLPLPEP
jgi:hypothetical protein